MKGSAPNWPATGSQPSVRQKFSPNFSIDSIDCRVSSNPMAATMSTSSPANAPVPRRKPRSVTLRLPVRPALPDTATALPDLDLRQCGHLELHHFGRQRRVPELSGELLAVGERPLHEV